MKTILIIDDEPAILEVLSSLLEEEGYNTMTASNGREGLACLKAAPVELVLCDVMMPVMDGREVCRAMQKDAHYRSVPIILMSAAGITVSEECRYAALLAKPFELDDLLELVDHLIEHPETSPTESA